MWVRTQRAHVQETPNPRILAGCNDVLGRLKVVRLESDTKTRKLANYTR
ncbi:MAG: hypothetical protein ABH878_01530 [bacterium]